MIIIAVVVKKNNNNKIVGIVHATLSHIKNWDFWTLAEGTLLKGRRMTIIVRFIKKAILSLYLYIFGLFRRYNFTTNRC